VQRDLRVLPRLARQHGRRPHRHDEGDREKAVDLILQTTVAQFVTIEFQGGEPLVNFPVVKHLIEYAEAKNREVGKYLEFTMVSNLALMDEEKLAWLLDHKVQICTSIDGPEAPLDAFEAIEHYSNAQFNHNAALGPDGQDDDMNAPDEKAKNEKHWDAAAMRDRGLLGGALEAAKAYKAAVVTASASGGAVAPEELKLADEAVEAATQLLENVPAWYSMASTVTAYGKAKRAMRLMVPRLREARGHAHLGESDLPSVNAG
jgi:hypothetical protein